MFNTLLGGAPFGSLANGFAQYDPYAALLQSQSNLALISAHANSQHIKKNESKSKLLLLEEVI